MRPREVGSHLDHLLEVLDFLPGPVSGTGPVGHCKVEEGLHRSGRQPDRLLQLLDRRLAIGRRQRRAEVRAGFRVGWREANRFTQRGNAFLVVPGLNEHESEVVVCFGVVRTDADRRAKSRHHIVARCTLPSEHEPEHVVRFGRLRLLTSSKRSACRSAAMAASQDGVGGSGEGTFSPASSCPRPFSRFPSRRKATPRST